jgi:hypothetical protein
VVQLAGNKYRYCARQGDGDVLCWAFSSDGPSAPKSMGLPAARDLSAGHSVCVTSAASGDVTCQDDLFQPAGPLPGLKGAIQLSANDVTCAVDQRGGVTCFDVLQLLVPPLVLDRVMAFPSDPPAVEVAAGLGYCVRRTDDSIACLNLPATTLTPVDNLPP